jgi:AcrR family transcriptional regulator
MSSQAERRTVTVAAILASARALFGARGFDATSIDDIAEGAGVAKGAVYHHFDSKEAIFTRVLEGVQLAILNTSVAPEDIQQRDLADQMADGVERYLLAASAPQVRQILLIDGPAVIGWRRWREIDDRYFGAGARRANAALLGAHARPEEVDALTHLLMGAVMEAAMVCATAADVEASARSLADSLRRVLKGLRPTPPTAPSPPPSATSPASDRGRPRR